MRSSRVLLATLVLVVLVAPIATRAFLDEVAQLREDLQVYQTTQAANFSDLVSKIDEIAGPSFKDVQDGQWYYKYVASVANWGVVSGYSNTAGQRTGMFGPQNPVTLAEALKMTFKAAQIDEKQCGSQPLMHAEAQTHWSALFVACAEQMHVRVVTDSAYINLDRAATRAEALSMIDDVFGETVPHIFSEFPDTQGHAYEADVAYGVMRGIVSGDSDATGHSLGTFRPDDSINRAEMSKLEYQELKARVHLQTQGQQS